MSSYIEISYPTPKTNYALKQCIEYIGVKYGNNKKYNNIYKSGKAYLAKKVKGASKTSINYMVYSKKVKDSKMRFWKLKKKSYHRVYEYIIYKMLKDIDNREKAISLLHSLYLELRENDKNISKIVSNILVSQEKEMLKYAQGRDQYTDNEKEAMDKILESYKSCDIIYNNYLTMIRRF